MLQDFQQKWVDSVQQTLKTEPKSWADVVKKGNSSKKQLTTKSVKEAVRSLSNEERRLKCFWSLVVRSQKMELRFLVTSHGTLTVKLVLISSYRRLV